MRALILSAAALALAGAVVLVGGRMVEGPVDSPVAIDQPDAEAIGAAEQAMAAAPTAALPPAEELVSPVNEPKSAEAAPAQDAATASPVVQPPSAGVTPQAPAAQTPVADETHSSPEKPSARSRLVAPAIIAPPDLAAGGLQREAPREPLSQLSLALPPQPKMKNEWAGTPFFRPVAIESAVFESMGRTIAISGVESVPLDESCAYEGISWQCGVRARTAFRLWLRGRALVCQLPDEEQAVTHARCRLAKQDAGAWLVANGWARAMPDGPYAQAEEKARAEGMGIFGAPPDASSISAVPDAGPSAPLANEPVMTEEGIDPQPTLGPEADFPPAP